MGHTVATSRVDISTRPFESLCGAGLLRQNLLSQGSVAVAVPAPTILCFAPLSIVTHPFTAHELLFRLRTLDCRTIHVCCAAVVAEIAPVASASASYMSLRHTASKASVCNSFTHPPMRTATQPPLTPGQGPGFAAEALSTTMKKSPEPNITLPGHERSTQTHRTQCSGDLLSTETQCANSDHAVTTDRGAKQRIVGAGTATQGPTTYLCT